MSKEAEVSIASTPLTAFANITNEDLTNAVKAAELIDKQIVGRVCGNYGDKISQYLAIASFFRTTHCTFFDSLEIGTLFGGSCIIKLMAMRNLGINGRLVCIDPMTGYYGNRLDPLSGIPVIPEIFWANLARFDFSDQHAELICLKSNDAAAIESVSTRKFATIMIDGDHSYEGVSSDWESYSPFIMDGGYILIDDFAEPSWPDITRFVRDRFSSERLQKGGWQPREVLGSTYILRKTHSEIPEAQVGTASISHIGLPEDIVYCLDARTLMLRLAATSLRLGETNEAETMYNQVLKSQLSPDGAHSFLAKLGLATACIEKNMDVARSIIEKLPYDKIPKMADTVPTIMILTDLLHRTGNTKSARDLYEQCLLFRPLSYLDRFNILVKTGNIALAAGEYGRAIQFYTHARSLPPLSQKDKCTAILGIAQCHMKSRSYAEAEEILLEGLNMAGLPALSRMYVLLALGDCFRFSQKMRQEKELYLKEIMTDGVPGAHKAGFLMRLGRIAVDEADFPTAERYYNECIAIEDIPDNQKTEVILALSLCLKRQKRFGEAATLLNNLRHETTLVNSHALQAGMNLADIFMLSADYAAAERTYEECLSSVTMSSSEKTELLLALSLCLKRQAKTIQCISTYLELIEKQPLDEQQRERVVNDLAAASRSLGFDNTAMTKAVTAGHGSSPKREVRAQPSVPELLGRNELLSLSKARMAAFHNIHRGKRCVIIGNGPSLNKMDLSFLEHEISFGMNRIFLIFDKWRFRPTYYVSVNQLVIEQSADDILALPMPKFLSQRGIPYFDTPHDDLMFIDERKQWVFSKDPYAGMHEGWTVTYVAMQLAYFMGFDEVVLIGVDHNFVTPGDPNKEVVSEGADPNHFHPDYFGKGMRWHLPDLERSEHSYLLAKEAFESSGRRIIDATFEGKLTLFPKVNYKEYFSGIVSSQPMPGAPNEAEVVSLMQQFVNQPSEILGIKLANLLHNMNLHQDADKVLHVVNNLRSRGR